MKRNKLRYHARKTLEVVHLVLTSSFPPFNPSTVQEVLDASGLNYDIDLVMKQQPAQILSVG